MNFLYSLFYLVALLCFIFVSAIITGLLCFRIFNYDKLKEIYHRRKPKEILQSDINMIEGVFLNSLLFVLAVTLYVKLIFVLNLKEINVSFFCITMLTVILCTFLINSNVTLINGKTFFGKFCKLCPMSCRIDKTQIVFNVLLILVFAIGIYIRNKQNISNET